MTDARTDTMFNRTVSPEDLTRLHKERQEADRLYNDALTALGNALQQIRDMPHSPPPYDEGQVTPLNERWDLLALRPPAEASGWRGRLRAFVWGVVGPFVERQHRFNAALVDHLNRNLTTQRGVTQSVGSVITLVKEELERLVAFQHRLLQYAQQITAYVDTKDREVAGLMRRINEDVAETANALVGAVNGFADELRKQQESTRARERRHVEQEQQAAAQVADVRASFASAQQVMQMLRRELSRIQHAAPADAGDLQAPAGSRIDAAVSSSASSAALDSYKYVGFEDAFRGSSDDIGKRLAVYLPYFDGASDVLDIGCGRGEFLELLRARGVTARGIDINHEMVEVCRARGLDAVEGDVVSYLGTLPDASLGGVFSAQVVEHLEPSYLLALLDAVFLKLRPGARLILETINAASWSAFFHSYIRDITHVRPLHPETLQYLVRASGMQKVEILYGSPYPDAFKLEGFDRDDLAANGRDPAVRRLMATVSQNAEKLNTLLFADQDYAVIGER